MGLFEVRYMRWDQLRMAWVTILLALIQSNSFLKDEHQLRLKQKYMAVFGHSISRVYLDDNGQQPEM